MKRSVLLASAMLGAMFFVPAAVAQTSSNSDLETVIVTGKRTAEQPQVPLKAVYTESSISKEQILNLSPSPATSLQTMLNTQPSIYATTGGPNGMNTNIKFRSFADGEFGETVQGVPLNDIFNGGVMSQADNRNNVLFTPRDVDAVDIYRGVNNPAVNTYNSLGGTINYTLRQPTDTFGGDVGVDGGSFNTFDYHATVNTGDIDGIRQTVSFERDSSSGWFKATPDWNDNLYYAGNADVSANTQVFAYFTYNKNVGDAPEDVPFNLIKEFGHSYQYPKDIHYQTDNDTNLMGIAGFKSQITNILSVVDEAYIGDNDYVRTAYTNPADEGNPYYLYNAPQDYAYWSSWMPYTGVAQFGSTAAGTAYQYYGYHGSVYGDNLKVTADLPFNTVTAGGDFNVGELHSREYWYGSKNMPLTTGYNDAWNEHDTRQMWSAFIQDDVHLWDDRIHITPGIKYISAASKDNDAVGFYYSPPGSLRNDDHFWSPTVGASIEPIDNFTVYGSYGKNVKFPDITSLYNELGYGGVVPPATVKPEYVEDYEAGARYQLDSLQLELNAYEENFSDIIYSIQLPSGASFQENGGKERYRGVEFQLTQDFGDIGFGNLKSFLNASYNEAVCESDFGYGHSVSDTSGGCNKGQSLANVPNYLLNGGLTWDYSGWHVDLTGQFVGKQHLEDYYTYLPEPAYDLAPGQPTHIKSYVLFNLGVVKVIPLDDSFANALRLSVHVDNIFNTHYFADAETDSDANNSNYLNDVYARMGEPRAVYGSVSIYF
jgi:outer membrane receptor protein involved in Fe transport